MKPVPAGDQSPGGELTYVSQVDALLALAEGDLARARRSLDTPDACSRAIARAFEKAVCAVFMAWGEPYKATLKVHARFGERLAPFLDPDELLVTVARCAWDGEGIRWWPDDQSEQMLSLCESALARVSELVSHGPPPHWEPLPVPPPVAWSELADDERQFLQAAAVRASEGCPGVTLYLFGSRAAGSSEEDSDYDLVFVFPDAAGREEQGRAVGDVNVLARSLGVVTDVEKFSSSQWADPAEVSQPLVQRIRLCSLAIPTTPEPDSSSINAGQ